MNGRMGLIDYKLFLRKEFLKKCLEVETLAYERQDYGQPYCWLYLRPDTGSKMKSQTFRQK